MKIYKRREMIEIYCSGQFFFFCFLNKVNFIEEKRKSSDLENENDQFEIHNMRTTKHSNG